MFTFFSRKILLCITTFIVLDILAVGIGMGVPIFAILLGFVIGWFTPSILSSTTAQVQQLLRRCLVAACLTSSLTFLLMLVIWGPLTRMLFDPLADIANFGIPLILFQPRASFIGWIVLMIVISPCLQTLATGFASSVCLAWFPPGSLREDTHP